MKLVITGILFLLSASVSLAQTSLQEREADLVVLLDSLRASTSDELKTERNELFRSALKIALLDPEAFAYPFSQLKTLGVINSPDNKVRVITWNVEQTDQSQVYGGFILHKENPNKEHEVFELTDNSYMLEYKTDEVLTGENWYGALYYKIIPVEKSNKTYYTLLGWDGHTAMSSMKLVDVLSFSGNGVKFGAAMFKIGSTTRKRVYFEHSEKAVMSLRWEDDQQRILFDHLSPESPNLEGFYEYYVPDMSYDALEFQGTKWVLVEDVIGLNKDSETVKMHHLDPKTGELEEEEVKNTWEDPTSEGAPGGKEVHVAVTTEGGSETKTDPKGKNEGGTTALDKYNQKKRHKKEPKPGESIITGGKTKKKHR